MIQPGRSPDPMNSGNRHLIFYEHHEFKMLISSVLKGDKNDLTEILMVHLES